MNELEKQRADERKKTYEPPKIEETADFETLALSCGKFGGTPSCYQSGSAS